MATQAESPPIRTVGYTFDAVEEKPDVPEELQRDLVITSGSSEFTHARGTRLYPK
jgi:hypothetical protein